VPRRRAAPAAAIKASSKGELFVICHAATQDGLLVGRNADGSRVVPPASGPDKDGTFATAEWIWNTKDKSADVDYHSHVTADKIVQYFERRLFPAARAVYPGRRVIVILDNSANHKAKPSSYVKLSGAKKEMVQALKDLSPYQSIHVQRNGVDLRFRRAQWDKNPSRASPRTGGPSKAEVANALRCLYEEQLALARSKLQTLMASQVCRRRCRCCATAVLRADDQCRALCAYAARVCACVRAIATERTRPARP
jgi:hypothetical protein